MKRLYKVLFILIFAIILVLSINCQVHATEEEREYYGEESGKSCTDKSVRIILIQSDKKIADIKVTGIDITKTTDIDLRSYLSEPLDCHVDTKMFVVFLTDELENAYVDGDPAPWDSYTGDWGQIDWICFEHNVPSDLKLYTKEARKRKKTFTITVKKDITATLNIIYEISNPDYGIAIETFYQTYEERSNKNKSNY